MSRLAREAVLIEANALGEELPRALARLTSEFSTDPERLATLEVSRSWDVCFADMLRGRRAFLDTVVLAFVRHPATIEIAVNRTAQWSGAYFRAVARDADRAKSGISSTLEFANMALDVAMREGRLALTVFSSAIDVGGIAFSVRGANGAAVSFGETNMLGCLELAIPADGSFELVLEPPATSNF